MRKFKTLIGQRFGMLTVTEQMEPNASGHRRWLCQCDCGGTHITTTGNLNQGRTTNCGCVKSPDLTGQVFGRLTVLGRSQKRGSRGARTTPMWECKCQCGNIVYKATDSLNNPDESMCAACAGERNSQKARQACGYVAGTQLSRLRSEKTQASNSTGSRGVYYISRLDRYRVRLKFQGRSFHVGYFTNLEDAVKARRRAEEEIYGKFLASLDQSNNE